MNLLPSMLITAAIIGSAGNMQAENSATENSAAENSATENSAAGISFTEISAADITSLQDQLKDSYPAGQIIIGNSSNIETILDSLLTDIGSLESLKDCFPPQLPDIENPNLPDTDIPDTDVPDDNHPDSGDAGSGTEEDINKNYAEQVVAFVNIERARAGLPALNSSGDLNKAALIRAKETTQSFSHTRPNGSSFSSVLTENGISYHGSGENIAWGQRTPEAVVNAWMNSDGHRANILNPGFTSIGVGYYLNNGTTPYWAQLFTY